MLVRLHSGGLNDPISPNRYQSQLECTYLVSVLDLVRRAVIIPLTTSHLSDQALLTVTMSSAAMKPLNFHPPTVFMLAPGTSSLLHPPSRHLKHDWETRSA
jgi:hypothetical protein